MSYDIYRRELLNTYLTAEMTTNLVTINICNISINEGDGGRPFLEFKLAKMGTTLGFESFPHQRIITPTTIAKLIIKNRPHITHDLILGYIIFETGIYCFIKFETETEKLYKGSDTNGIVISDELVNQRHTFGIGIAPEVYRFFIKNQNCLHLKDENKKQILAPKAYYYGDTDIKRNYLIHNGIPKQLHLGIFGSYYYVHSFEDAILYAGWSSSGQPLKIKNREVTIGQNGKFIQGTIFRCLIFMENVDCKMNKLNDKIDTSSATVLLKSGSDYIAGNLRISDRDCKWTHLYDTIYSGVHKPFMPTTIIAHAHPVMIYNYAQLNMSKLPVKKTDIYTSVEIK